MSTSQKIDKRIQRHVRIAMSKLVIESPFFNVLLTQQDLIYSTDVPTFATNGNAIFVNPIYAKSLTSEEIQGVLVHELMHTMLMHITRCGERDHKLYNAAADYAINPILKKEGFILPKNHLDEDRFHGKTADEIYRILDKEDFNMPEHLLDIQSNPNLTSSQKTQIEQNTKLNNIKASTIAGADVPSSIRKLVTEVIETKVDWRTKLRDFIQVALGGDTNTWKKPNRNYIHDDLYIPSREGIMMPSIAILIDTSGSIYCNEKLFVEFQSEIKKIVEDMRPEQVDIYYVDTIIKGHSTFEEDEEIEFDLVGGGGSDFTSAWPVMEAVNPACIIAFTDCYITFPETSEVPTLWIVYENNDPKPPFGSVTCISEN